MHKIRRPFMCRYNQFGNGREVSFGVDLETLLGETEHRFTLGKKEYFGPAREAIKFSRRWRSEWTNKKGKRVCILPLSFFKERGKDEGNESRNQIPPGGSTCERKHS